MSNSLGERLKGMVGKAETGGSRQFLTLLYKGLLLRKRHYVVTFFEIVIPVLIASIPAIIHSESSFPDTDFPEEIRDRSFWKNYTTFQPFSPYDTRLAKLYDLHFVYTPDTDNAKKFITQSVDRFKRELNYKGDITFKAVRNEEEMQTYCLYKLGEEISLIILGTVLKNFDTELPESLDYKIRYGNAMTYTSFSTAFKYRVNGPQPVDQYQSSFFLAWQMSVEETFIEEKKKESGKEFDYRIAMQRLPYPEHRDVTGVFSIISLVPWVIAYGYLVFIINIVRRMIEEKANGSKELLKMMGMTDTVYWTSTFMNYFIIGAITMLIITIVYKVPMKNSAVFMKHTDFVLLFLLFVLFMANLVFFCMAFSIFFNRSVFAVIALIVVHVLSFSMLMSTYFLLNTEVSYLPMPLIYKLGICLLPSGSLLTIFLVISFFETYGHGAQWSNLTDFTIIPDLNILMVILAMLVSCLLLVVIIWYFDKVWPWQYGVPKPFYFLFTRAYWFGPNRKKEGDELQLVQEIENSGEFFEEEPSGTSPGVVIRNLTKEFRTGFQTKLAVNNLSLNIYQGQITALLGHNGAGKTTTINILTGLYMPSSGSATINGLDILTETTQARRGLGVCPQHNVLYDTLTVGEHLKFYAAIKGVKWSKLNDEAENVLKLLNLKDKRNELVKNLSGGMKRKLSLGIAIIGGSKVLFLDEPTSGMDVEARRSVWDALLDIRHDRTIILTTHYMEEADILGDRIAIMAEGEVQCCGSPMFLKQKFGTGYHLHVVKDAHFDLNLFASLLQHYLPNATVGNEVEKEISFGLSMDTGHNFGDLFEEMERQKELLGVLSYGITITTMEDVFLNVSNISDTKYKILAGNKQTNNIDDEPLDDLTIPKKVLVDRSITNQLHGLILKRFHYAKRYWAILIAQLGIPLLLMFLCLKVIKSASTNYSAIYDPMKMDIYDVYGATDGFYFDRNEQQSEITNTIKDVYKANRISAISTQNPTQYVLDYGKKDISRFLKDLLVGAAVDTFQNGTYNLTAWYNGEPYHVTPMSLLLMHTAILKHVTKTGTISLVNAPLPEHLVNYSQGSKFLELVLAAIFTPLALAFLTASYVLVPIQERSSKAKLLQLMSGVPPVIYWISMFIWDFFIHALVSSLLIVPFAMFYSFVFFGPHSEAIGTVILMLLLYGWASIPFSYIMSFIFNKGNAGFSAIVGLCVIVGVGAGSTLKSIQTSMGSYESPTVDVMVWAFRLLPSFSVSFGFSNLFGMAFDNALCDSFSQQDLDFNCNSPSMQKWNAMWKCCKNLCKDDCLVKVDLFNMSKTGCSRDILFLALDGLIYFTILLLLETTLVAALARAAKQLLLKMRKRLVGAIQREHITEDSAVLREEDRIRDIHAVTNSNAGGEALMVVDLSKVFRNFYAVDHLSFGIHEEECFGLLGVNGAGKTTTFRMLTGDCYPTEGNAYIKDASLMANLKQFQSYLGYCPQFDALIDRLTGREMLALFGRLRGLSGSDLEQHVNQLVKLIDLTAHADKQTQFYSGGNKRKLSVGLSLIGSPPLILLDEPTAGVDPGSRRKIWSILAQMRGTGAAVILTTHSMEESEALCSRLAIMVNGRFRCLGSIQELKSKYGQGYTLIVKLKREDQDDYQSTEAVKSHIAVNLSSAELKDDHQGMLQYHVVDPTISLSRLFKFMSNMKEEFNLEDYLISDTSLEQIFLTFARAQRITS